MKYYSTTWYFADHNLEPAVLKSCGRNMSYSKVFVMTVILSILFSCLLEIGVLGDKIEKKIYRDLHSFLPCVTLLNATHQIGCTSKRKGDVGVLHYIDSDKDFEWLLNKGEHAPYIPLFTAEYFTNEKLKQLADADKVSGALVVYHSNTSRVIYPSKGYSPAHSCPKENFGLYKNDKKYGCGPGGGPSIVWNTFGTEMSYRQFDFPVFVMTHSDEIDMLVDCYKKHNKPVAESNPDYPLCAVEMKSFMFAAKDTPTCMRKNEAPTFNPFSFCDPLGDYNVWGTLFPLVGKIEKDDVILATAKLDSTSFFHDIAPGADNDATGVVALLAASKALGDLKRQGQLSVPDVKKNEKHIMFTFFQGEVWDYIGSSRMVYDMMRGAFPCSDNDCILSNVNISNIAYFLELSQVGFLDEGSLWAHSDPLSFANVGTKVDKMYNLLSNFGDDVDLSIKNASNETAQPLPPASFQRFLRKNSNIPGLVISDHKRSYTNKFYNSRFDDNHNLNFTSENSAVVKQITSLATTVARTLYQLAYNKRNENITADKKVVVDLLFCFLMTANCDAFKNVTTKKYVDNLAKQKAPFPRYVGTFAQQDTPYLPITTMTKLFLAFSTGLYNYTNGTCKDNKKTNYALNRMHDDTNCVNATVYLSPAQSPAFLLKDYASTEYSTWTESRWGGDNSIRMFLIADPTHEIVTLAVGIVLTLLSLLATVFMYTKADQLFTPDDPIFTINDVQ